MLARTMYGEDEQIRTTIFHRMIVDSIVDITYSFQVDLNIV